MKVKQHLSCPYHPQNVSKYEPPISNHPHLNSKLPKIRFKMATRWECFYRNNSSNWPLLPLNMEPSAYPSSLGEFVSDSRQTWKSKWKIYKKRSDRFCMEKKRCLLCESRAVRHGGVECSSRCHPWCILHVIPVDDMCVNLFWFAHKVFSNCGAPENFWVRASGNEIEYKIWGPDVVLCQRLQLVPERGDDANKGMPDNHELEVVNTMLSAHLAVTMMIIWTPNPSTLTASLRPWWW